MKKFELTQESKINWLGRTLFRIKACIDFTTITGDEVKKVCINFCHNITPQSIHRLHKVQSACR